MGRKVLDTQPVGRLPLIVSYVVISLKENSIFIIIHSHTHQHTSSKQLGISSQTLIYIYHTWHYITPKAKSQTWQHQRIIRQHQEHKHIHSNSHTMFIKPKRYHQACPQVGPGRVCAQPGNDPISWGLLNLDPPPIRRRQRFEWSDVVGFRSGSDYANRRRILPKSTYFCLINQISKRSWRISTRLGRILKRSQQISTRSGPISLRSWWISKRSSEISKRSGQISTRSHRISIDRTKQTGELLQSAEKAISDGIFGRVG